MSLPLDQPRFQALQAPFVQMNEDVSDVGWSLKASITRIKEALDLTNVFFFLVDPDTDDFYLAASALSSAAEIDSAPISPKNDLFQQALDAQAPVSIIDAGEWNDRAAFRLTPGALSVALFPLRVGGNVAGMLILESDRESAAFAEPVQTLIGLLVDQIAIILQAGWRVQHRSEIAAQGEHNVLLINRLSATLNASLDAYEVLNMTIIHLVELSGADYGGALILGRHLGRDWSDGQVVAEHPGDHFIDQRLPLPDSPSIRRMLASGGPYVVENVSEDLLLSPLSERLSHLRPRSMLLAPMVVHRQLIGVLILISQTSPTPFSEAWVEICQNIACQAAAAVSNARLLQDMQRQKRALTYKSREMTKESRALSAIIDNIADGVLVTDRWGRILLANPAFQALIAPACQQLAGRPLPELLSEAGLTPFLQRALETPHQAFIAHLALSDGRVLKTSSTALTLPPPIARPKGDEQITGVVTILQDITCEVDRVKTNFIDAVSHELCTPLTAILGFANLIQRDFNRWIGPQIDGEKEARIAQRIVDNLMIIESESRRLGQLVSDLVNVSAVEGGEVDALS